MTTMTLLRLKKKKAKFKTDQSLTNIKFNGLILIEDQCWQIFSQIPNRSIFDLT